jgi:hypothetical protein
MSNSNFQLWVLQVLVKNHYVSIPELGSFTLRELESTANTINREYKPRHSQLIFSNKTNNEDSFLIECVISYTGSSYKDAVQLIKDEVVTLKSQLIQKKYFSFGSLGNFFFNPTSGIFFVGRNQSNLHAHAFGLMPLKWEIKSKSQETKNNPVNFAEAPVNSEIITEDAKIVDIDNQFLEQSIERHRGIKIWNIAASVALVSITAGAVYLMSLSWKQVLNNQQMASQIPVPSVNDEAPEFMMVNGKLISTKSKELNMNDSAMAQSTVDSMKLSSHFTIDEYRSKLVKESGKYFVVGGSYMTESAAQLECKHWEKLGFSSTYIRVKNSSLLKIILKRFEKEQDASDFAVSIKDQPTQSISVQNLHLQ